MNHIALPTANVASTSKFKGSNKDFISVAAPNVLDTSLHPYNLQGNSLTNYIMLSRSNTYIPQYFPFAFPYQIYMLMEEVEIMMEAGHIYK